jgi:hypothetical protein
MERVPEDNAPIHGIDWLPKEGLVVDSVQYFKADAMSLDFLTDTFLGNYMEGDDKVRAFITKRSDDAEATEIFAEFKTYGGDYAESVVSETIAGQEVALTDWGGDYYDGVVQIGNTIAGIANIEGKDNAVAAMADLIGKL